MLRKQTESCVSARRKDMLKRLWSNEALKMGISSSTLVVMGRRPPCWPKGRLVGTAESHFYSSSSDERNKNNRGKPELAAEGHHNMSFSEVKKLTRLVNVKALKKKLGTEQAEVINYIELLDACEKMGVARSREEASNLARALDEAGVVLLFRDKVYLHPDKVAEVVRRAVPLVLSGEEEKMRREELVLLQKKKDEIDAMAHKQVRRILWGVLGLGVVQVGLFFRLTFWEFSWDVMEPITFFTTSTGILMGYAYFLFTARDPSYQDFMQRLFLARQRKLFKLRNFDAQRFKELRDKCTPANHLPSQLNLVEVDDHHGP